MIRKVFLTFLLLSVAMPVFLEVNVSGEPTKHGFDIRGLKTAISTIRSFKNLSVKGLMTIAPFTDNEQVVRRVFKKLRHLADKFSLDASMGMSNDWRIAVQEGADVIRIGGRIFMSHEEKTRSK